MGVIDAVGVTKRYRSGGAERVVLDDVSLSLEYGGFLSIMGPSGSGKSSLLHVLGGIDRSHEGAIRVDGIELAGCDDDAIAAVRRDSIGFVFQAFNLVPVLTAIENVALPGVIAGRPSGASDARALELLDRFGLADRAEQRPTQLSGGEQQRVAIARALFLEPAVLLADEPTGNLDSQAGAEVMEVLVAAHRDLGQSIVLVTHDASVASQAREVRVLRAGTISDPFRFESPGGALRHRQLVSWLDTESAAPRPARTRPLVAR